MFTGTSVGNSWVMIIDFEFFQNLDSNISLHCHLNLWQYFQKEILLMVENQLF